MKFVYNDLGSVKKEAVKLHKFAKSHNLKSKLSLAQNVMAEAYGWKHFNEMSRVHERIRKNEIEINVPHRQILPSHKHQYDSYCPIEASSNLQKKTLDGRKHLCVEKYFASLGVNWRLVESLALQFFSSAGMINKFFKGKDAKVDSLSDIPREQSGRGVLTKLDNQYDCVEVYFEMCVPRIVDFGGVMVLDRHVAEKLIPHLMRFNDLNKPVSVVDFSVGKFNPRDYGVDSLSLNSLDFSDSSFCPLGLAVKGDMDEYRDALLRQSPDLTDDEIKGELGASLLDDFLKKVGEKISTNPDYHDEFTYDTSLLLLSLSDPESYASIQKAIEKGGDDSLEFNAFLAYLNRHVMTINGREEHPYLVEEKPFLSMSLCAFDVLLKHRRRFDSFQTNCIIPDSVDALNLACTEGRLVIKESGHAIVPASDGKSFRDRFYEGEIIIAVVDRGVEDSIYMSRIFMGMCRHYIALLLGNQLEAKEPFSRQRMFVIDQPECLPLGSAVVFAQMRGLGMKWLVNVPSYSQYSQSEYASLIANASVFILSKLSADEKDALIQETRMYQFSKELLDLLVFQLSSGFDALQHNNQFAVIFLGEFTDWESRWVAHLVDKCQVKDY